MHEHALYNPDDNKWYKEGADPWTVRLVIKGVKLEPLMTAVADTYFEAVDKLFGHPPVLPPLVRLRKHEVIQ